MLREIDEGWDFKVLVLDESWAVRIPRRTSAADALRNEIALLPELAPALPVVVPHFELISEEPLFVVYRLIEGRALENEDPAGVRAFLTALHGIDIARVRAPQPSWIDIYREHADDWRRLVLPLLDVDERRRGEALLGEVEMLTGFTPALIHCDLGPEHLLCRDGRLVGVIDWADAKIGDPALDYSWLLNVPFPDWEVDEELRRRALIYHRLAPWFEVDYGSRIERPELIRSGLAGVRTRL